MVDDFLNHRVDPDVMHQIGVDMAKAFVQLSPELVLTAEASGIPPALTCAAELSIPMVYAKKYVGPGNRYTFSREVTSPTKGTEYRVEVARRVMVPGTRVLIVDDFLARGRTAEALGEITLEAAASSSVSGSSSRRHGWKDGNASSSTIGPSPHSSRSPHSRPDPSSSPPRPSADPLLLPARPALASAG